MYFINLSKGWYSKLEQRKAYTTIMKASGCKKGYATYWNAYSNEIYCDLNIRFGGIKFDGNKITPHYWLVDSDVFNYSNNEPSFLLLDCNQMDYTKDNNIEKIYGKPNRILTYLGYTIYVFDYDIASKFIGIK